MSNFRTITVTGALAIGVLAIAACGDTPTAPQPSLDVAMPAAENVGARRIPNRIKYRDSGHRPATGHAGSATLTVSALLGSDGVTDVELLAGSRAGAGSPSMSKVQLKAFSAAGEELYTRNENHVGGAALSFELGGLPRNSALRVHANIRGVDGRRTDVVFVNDMVKLRPDIAVLDLQVPEVVWTQTPTIVTTTLSEINGDVGARANCVLQVDGVAVDSAVGVWIDAGGSVSCAFAIDLANPGEHTITVRATNVAPGDWSVNNNMASASVTVGREVPLSYSATARDDSLHRWNMFFHDFTTGGGSYHSARKDSSDEAGRNQSSSLTAYSTERLEFPEQPLGEVHLAQRTGSSLVHEASYGSLPADNAYLSADSTSGCVSRTDGAIVTTFTLCSKRIVRDGVTSSHTSITYRWDAGDVTYRSIGYEWLSCRPVTPVCQPYSYTHNNVMPSIQGRRAEFGSDFRFTVDFRSGLTRFLAEPTVTLSPTYTVSYLPSVCATTFGVDPFSGLSGITTYCQRSLAEIWRMSGQATGP